jgi:methylmalonyl-CoA mutase C-terminal domain/subunit
MRVLVAKVGLDGHDRGAKVVARALTEAGIDVVYGGLHQTPEAVVEMALKENVSLIAISILSGAHMAVFPRILELLKEKGAENIKIFGGGIIPQDDIETLQGMGVGKLFSPGTTLGEIVEYVKASAE